MSTFNWAEFANVTKDHPQHWLLERAESLVPDTGLARYALDLGSGAGRGTRFLLSKGWRVTAVDGEAVAVELVRAIGGENLTVVQSGFEEFDYGVEKYDLVSAQFSLPFVPYDQFPEVFARIKRGIKPGGIFAGQFFGIHDEWNRPGNRMTFLRREDIDAVMDGMRIAEITEDDKRGGTATGETKHWHVFHVIAEKNQSQV